MRVRSLRLANTADTKLKVRHLELIIVEAIEILLTIEITIIGLPSNYFF
jgi:hypothetical protein